MGEAKESDGEKEGGKKEGVVIVLYFISVLLAFQQKQAPVRAETVEHKFVRLRLEEAKRQEKIIATDQCEKYNDDLHKKAQCLREGLEALKQNFILQGLLTAQLDNVDDCTKLYRRTSNKKTSDVTVKENEDIKGCLQVELYPLNMKGTR